MWQLVLMIKAKFADFPYKPLLLIYGAMALTGIKYACIRAIVQHIRVNRFRKKLENVIVEKYKNKF